MASRLKKPEPTGNDNSVKLEVAPPQVRVRIPDIQIPEIKVPESVVNMDTAPIAEVMKGVGQMLTQLAQQQSAILQTIQEHHAVINKALGNQPNIEVQAPVIKSAPRPRSFTVEVEDEAGDVTAKMNIRANSPN